MKTFNPSVSLGVEPACQHFRAEAVSTTEAHQLRDGRWRYRRDYRCPECGRRFSEQHTQERRLDQP